ncbi:MAG: zinc ribbon domain-containing protein [Pyrinomonadaceae bacterium]|nr:zinc ribbon domain-containing protein [Pyrinomonadaceae bacterium]
MHCPQCGQQQVVEEMRFCSRCGFPLSVITEVLSHGGTLPEREAEASAPKLTSRQRGKRLAVILLLTGILLAMIGGIINEPGNAGPLDIGLAGTLLLFGPAIICIVAGFVRLLYALLLEGNAPSRSRSPALKASIGESVHLDAGSYRAVLPASPGIPVSDFGTKRVKTAEMANAPSVTENTTKLLDEQ